MRAMLPEYVNRIIIKDPASGRSMPTKNAILHYRHYSKKSILDFKNLTLNIYITFSIVLEFIFDKNKLFGKL